MPDDDIPAEIQLRGSWDSMPIEEKRGLFERTARRYSYDLYISKENQPDEWQQFFEKIIDDFMGSIDEAEISAELSRVIGSTQFSEEDFENGDDYGGAPTKDTLHNLAYPLEAHKAMAELIDNIIDNYITNIKNEIIFNDLEITIQIYYKKNQHHYILIRENSGGISKAKWNAINTPGISMENDNAVSTYGQGTKISLAALGRDNSICTNHITEQHPVYFRYSPTYYDPKNQDWKVVPKKVTGGWVYENPGCTEYHIGESNKPGEETFLTEKGQVFGISQNDEEYEPICGIHPIRHLCHWFGLIYSKQFEVIKQLGREYNFEIISPVEDKPLRVLPITIDSYEDISLGLSYPEGDEIYNVISNHTQRKPRDWSFMQNVMIEPLYCETRIQMPVSQAGKTRDLDLSVKVLVGMTSSVWREDSGAWLWGNNRLFAQSVSKEIFGLGTNRSIDGNTTGRVFLFVELEAENPRDIPWGAPIKWAYNPEHPVSKKLASELRLIAYRYLEISNRLYGLTEWYESNVVIEE